MKPVSPAPDNDNLRQSPAQPASTSSDTTSDTTSESPNEKAEPTSGSQEHQSATAAGPASDSLATPSVSFSGQLLGGPSLTGQLAGPLEKLQRRYTDQLSQDIEGLEAQKSKLECDVAALKAEYSQLQADLLQQVDLRKQAGVSALVQGPTTQEQTTQEQTVQGQALENASNESEKSNAVDDSAQVPAGAASAHTRLSGPRLPGEPERLAEPGSREPKLTDARALSTSESPSPRLPGESPETDPVAVIHRDRAIELPIPSTSEQRRQLSIQLREPGDIVKANPRKGMVLSAIAVILMAWHYSLISTLGQGGSWLGLPVGELGSGFVPTVALLWLRMLVTVPVLGLLAPQLYKNTWEDLQEWIYTRDQLLIMLIGSGVALFFSQVLIYQCVGVIGPVLGTTLLFLYPLTAVPLGALVAQEQRMTPLGWLALVAIAMGGVLAMRPFFGGDAPASATLGLGLGASIAFSLYIVLTNKAYRQQCHPVPVGIVQFSTVAVLSSLVLLVKPLRLANISWLGLAVWGLLLGIAMLLVYLLTYSSLRMIGPRTAIVAAATPLVTALVAIGFSPWAPLEIIQWTGVFMVAIGGIALGKEKMGGRG